ncbi:helix-turn-helix domain-containing protein [Spirosoma sp. KNUC1025]|nr:helix-turn-helix domain-containing protein [Spirosoma sp. KNUC1025]UFH57504.1 helix-turn-helix domain-containing protein [Spirosoma sp. KNUC1025]
MHWYNENKYSVKQIARELHISKTTLYKYLRQRGVEFDSSVQNPTTTA